ncbi:MAG: hypothetical protein JXB00_18135 [Bacteroidales bacterium]|nr:hypothetical protein [Bacteroidales bacterium]
MKSKYNLGYSFGPVGTTAGIFMFLTGIPVTYFDPAGLILVVLGSFVGFTRSGSIINFEQKKIKPATYLFGIFPVGKWMALHEGMKLGIKKSAKSWTAYSRSNRQLNVADIGYRVILCDSKNKEIMPVLKVKNSEQAKKELEKINVRLKLQLI